MRAPVRARVGTTVVGALVALLAMLVGAAPALATTPTPAPTPPTGSTPPVPLPVPPPGRTYAPLDRPGPALTVSAGALARSLRCSPGVAGSRQDPILLIPGTTLTPDVNFSWNYERAFAMTGRPYCTVELPNHAMSDIQTSAEYVVSAIRTMSARSHHRVSIVGFSQGGMIWRWALRFWPDTRPRTGQVVGIDPSNHGTLDAYPACTGTGCAPAFWQQQSFSNFTTALNSDTETFAGIGYTSVFTPSDEVVVPNVGPAASSSLNTGAGRRANVSTYDVYPGHPADHLSMGSSDAVAYAVVVDALDHGGVADAARIDRAVCLAPFQPGVDPRTFPRDAAGYYATTGFVATTYPHVPAEPPLRSYVFAS